MDNRVENRKTSSFGKNVVKALVGVVVTVAALTLSFASSGALQVVGIGALTLIGLGAAAGITEGIKESKGKPEKDKTKDKISKEKDADVKEVTKELGKDDKSKDISLSENQPKEYKYIDEKDRLLFTNEYLKSNNRLFDNEGVEFKDPETNKKFTIKALNKENHREYKIVFDDKNINKTLEKSGQNTVDGIAGICTLLDKAKELGYDGAIENGLCSKGGFFEWKEGRVARKLTAETLSMHLGSVIEKISEAEKNIPEGAGKQPEEIFNYKGTHSLKITKLPDNRVSLNYDDVKKSFEFSNIKEAVFFAEKNAFVKYGERELNDIRTAAYERLQNFVKDSPAKENFFIKESELTPDEERVVGHGWAEENYDVGKRHILNFNEDIRYVAENLDKCVDIPDFGKDITAEIDGMRCILSMNSDEVILTAVTSSKESESKRFDARTVSYADLYGAAEDIADGYAGKDTDPDAYVEAYRHTFNSLETFIRINVSNELDNIHSKMETYINDTKTNEGYKRLVDEGVIKIPEYKDFNISYKDGTFEVLENQFDKPLDVVNFLKKYAVENKSKDISESADNFYRHVYMTSAYFSERDSAATFEKEEREDIEKLEKPEEIEEKGTQEESR